MAEELVLLLTLSAANLASTCNCRLPSLVFCDSTRCFTKMQNYNILLRCKNVIYFLGAKAPLVLAHVKKKKKRRNEKVTE